MDKAKRIWTINSQDGGLVLKKALEDACQEEGVDPKDFQRVMESIGRKKEEALGRKPIKKSVHPIDCVETVQQVLDAIKGNVKRETVFHKLVLADNVSLFQVYKHAMKMVGMSKQLVLNARVLLGFVFNKSKQQNGATNKAIAEQLKTTESEVAIALREIDLFRLAPMLYILAYHPDKHGKEWFAKNHRTLMQVVGGLSVEDQQLLKQDNGMIIIPGVRALPGTIKSSSTPALAVRAAAAATAAGGGGPAPAASTVSVALPADASSAYNFAALSSALPSSSDGRITITISDTKTTRDVEVENDQSIASFFNSPLTWNAQFRDHTVYLQGKALSTAQTFRVAGVVAGTVLVLLPPQPAVAARVPLAHQMKVGPDETFTVRETTSGQKVVVPYLRQHTLSKLLKDRKPEVDWSKWRFEKDGVRFDVTKTLDALGIQAGDVLIVVARFFGGGPSVEASKPPEVSSEPAFIFGCDKNSWNATLQGKSNTKLKGWIDANGGKKKRQCLKANSKERLMQLAVEMQTARLESEEGTSTIVYEVQQPEGVGTEPEMEEGDGDFDSDDESNPPGETGGEAGEDESDGGGGDAAASAGDDTESTPSAEGDGAGADVAGVVVPASACLLFFLVQAIQNYEPGLFDSIKTFLTFSGGSANAVMAEFLSDTTEMLSESRPFRRLYGYSTQLHYWIVSPGLGDTPYSMGEQLLAGWNSADDRAYARGEEVRFDYIADAEPEPESSDDEDYVPSDDAESSSESSDGGESGEDLSDEESGAAPAPEGDGGDDSGDGIDTGSESDSSEEGDVSVKEYNIYQIDRVVFNSETPDDFLDEFNIPEDERIYECEKGVVRMTAEQAVHINGDEDALSILMDAAMYSGDPELFKELAEEIGLGDEDDVVVENTEMEILIGDDSIEDYAAANGLDEQALSDAISEYWDGSRGNPQRYLELRAPTPEEDRLRRVEELGHVINGNSSSAAIRAAMDAVQEQVD